MVEPVQKYCQVLFSHGNCVLSSNPEPSTNHLLFVLTTHHFQPFLNRLGEICIPNVKEVFTDLMLWDPEERISNKRERVMAKILVDVYMLCNLVERHDIRNDRWDS